MPAKPVSSGLRRPSGKSRKGKRDFLSKVAADLGNAARKAPGGVAQAFTALDQALPEGPIKSLERMAGERGGRHLDPTGVKKIANAQWGAIKDLKDPRAWDEHPGDQLLTVLGLVPLPGAAVGKVGKFTTKKPKAPRSRVITAKPKTDAQAVAWAKARGLDDPESFTTKSTFKVELPDTKVGLARGAQFLADKARSKSNTLSARKVERGIARDVDILQRRTDPADPSFVPAIKNLKSGKFYKFKQEPNRNRAIEAVRELNSGVRGARLYRLGYIPANWAGSRATNFISQGTGAIGRTRKTKAMSKALDQIEPGLSRRPDVAMGDGGAQAVLASGAKNPDILPGPIGTFMGGVGNSLAKVTDRTSRRNEFFAQAEKFGYNTPEKVANLLKGGTAKLDRDFVQIVRRAEPNAVKFTRSRPLPGRRQSAAQAVDRVAAENVFLYKWLTGSAGYSGRMLTDHPTLTAALAAQGQEAPTIDSILKKSPDFLNSYIPYAKEVGDKFPSVASTRALTLFDSPGEFVDTLAKAKDDPLNLINPLNPVQHAAGTFLAQREPFFGKQPEQETTSGYTRRGQDVDAWNTLKWSIDQELGGIPYRTFYERMRDPGKGLFPMSRVEAAQQFGLGSWMRKPVDPVVASKLWRKQEEEKTKGVKRKKKTSRTRSSRRTTR